jgi:ATP-dependent Lhr-like helicase
VLDLFHPAVREWFATAFSAPTLAQALGWPSIARGDSTLILAPTGSGKTLAAFLWCINRVMFEPAPGRAQRCRVVYVSPLKALAVDIEKNLRAPIAGIAAVASRRGDPHRVPAIGVRTGDTPPRERARFARDPADILITTPESLYLLLTSNAREVLRAVDAVIIDEIHALVPTKRGAHLAISLERLELLAAGPLQRIGLSATQRPLDEVAHFLGGIRDAPLDDTPSLVAGAGRGSARDVHASGAARGEAAEGGAHTGDERGAAASAPGQAEIHGEFAAPGGAVEYRPVTIVDAGERKALSLTIEVPVEDMARLREPGDRGPGSGSRGSVRSSIWTAIHPRVLELIRAHRSTLIFTNSRRLAERMAAALNELAGEPLARAHHGALARERRVEIEDQLKTGALRALVATSSLELGIDMGAIDLVIQIEAPPSVASGLQRIGRAGHQVGAASRGIVFPKFRGDLVACAAATRLMRDGRVEATRYPRNPLDVLAQQIVAMVALDRWSTEELFAAVRRAAPFAELSPRAFTGVLDMLSGRYPSDEFAELRPRLTWDRATQTLTTREGARRVAIVNGGTIPDRGLYGVFLAGTEHPVRVGELDEEMVFESRVGEAFLLGASTWRIEEITHDRVLVSPAPGQPGKMPFWRGDAPGRPLELGQHIGRLIRELSEMPAAAARHRLVRQHDLDEGAAGNLLQYLRDQAAAGAVPDDRTVVIERCRDEVGDWGLCVLSPLGGQIHAPWAMAAEARVRRDTGVDVETMWTDDGFVVRFPDSDDPPDPHLVLPDPDEVEALVLGQLGATALFAARFREAAARALLLPRRRPGGRAPLWQQRRRAADLLAVAARYASFPILLEVYRECLRDVFDMPALVGTLREVAGGRMRTVTLDLRAPSPFAAALLFGYVANYIYDGDAPLAERRAHALAIDHAHLNELLGTASLRELLDAEAIDAVARQLQHLDERFHARHLDGLHDLLLRVGDLSADEIRARTMDAGVAAAAGALVAHGRAIILPVAGTPRYVAVEDAARYRDALNIPLPDGIPAPLGEAVRDPHGDLVQRYARTHGPFTTDAVVRRYGMARPTAEATLRRLAAAGRLLEGEFTPGGMGREWCDPGVLSAVRRRSLARLRAAVEPVAPAVLGRLITTWQGVTRRRRGLDSLLDAVESLQGAPLAASIFEREILAARVEGYLPGDLDTLAAAGEVVWCGLEPLGERDGRIALFLTDQHARLWRPPAANPSPVDDSTAGQSETGAGRPSPLEERILAHLRGSGASFFGALHAGIGGGFAGDVLDALWNLVWRGMVSNDSFHALRAYTAPRERRDRRARALSHGFRSRRSTPPGGEGRWTLTSARVASVAPVTEWSAAVAQQLLRRHGVATRETVLAEGVPGGFATVYDVLKALEESGRIRRGYFATGVSAAQFALPAALEQLRLLRDPPDSPEVVLLAATDPANPYGAALRWPEEADRGGRAPLRTVGAHVVLVNGAAAAYIARGGRQLTVWLPDAEPERTAVACAVAQALADLALRDGLLLGEIDGAPAQDHPLAAALAAAGFTVSALGFTVRRSAARV